MKAIALLLIQTVWSLHFYLSEGVEKCLLVDTPVQTVVLGDYSLLDIPNEAGQGVAMKVQDPQSKLILQKLVTGPGKFSFTSQVEGQHRVCLALTGLSWLIDSRRVRFRLSVDHEIDEIDHSDLASKEELQHLQEITDSINSRLVEIAKQQDYAREKEARFKDESEVMNGRVMYLTLFQTLVILVAGSWQLLSLQRFFKSKNLL